MLTILGTVVVLVLVTSFVLATTQDRPPNPYPFGKLPPVPAARPGVVGTTSTYLTIPTCRPGTTTTTLQGGYIDLQDVCRPKP